MLVAFELLVEQLERLLHLAFSCFQYFVDFDEFHERDGHRQLNLALVFHLNRTKLYVVFGGDRVREDGRGCLQEGRDGDEAVQNIVEIGVEVDLGLHYLGIVFAAKTFEEGHLVL